MAIEGHRLMSKTQHYRKVTKPLLERKRRARMNHYLDELKDLIIETMEAQGEHVTKLEKADILEMTVQYLKTKKQTEFVTKESIINAEKFRAGYTQAAFEVSQAFTTIPGFDIKFGSKLVKHLSFQMVEDNTALLIATPVASTHNCFENIPYRMGNEGFEEPQMGDVWRPW